MVNYKTDKMFQKILICFQIMSLDIYCKGINLTVRSRNILSLDMIPMQFLRIKIFISFRSIQYPGLTEED